MNLESFITNEKERPTNKEPYKIGTFIKKRSDKKKWLYVKKAITESGDLREKNGLSRRGSLYNSEIIRMMIRILYDSFKKRDKNISSDLKEIEKENLKEEIDLYFRQKLTNVKDWRKQF